MLRWLFRLLVLAGIAAAAIMVISRLTNREEDFDDYDDLEGGFDFQETPVEIEVPAEQFASVGGGSGSAGNSGSSDSSGDAGGSSGSSSMSVSSKGAGNNGSAAMSSNNGSSQGTSTETTRLASEDDLTDIVGIGPAFDARLKAIGINSISDLANADANSINEQVDVIGGVATVEDWITQAKNLTSKGNSDSNGQ